MLDNSIYVLRDMGIWTILELTRLRVLGIPILLRVIGILKTRSTILDLAVRVLGIWTVLEFLKSAK